MRYLILSCVLGWMVTCSSMVARGDTITPKSSVQAIGSFRRCIKAISKGNVDANGDDSFFSADKNEMLFRAFIVSAKHLTLDDAIELLPEIFEHAHAANRWVELGNCYLYSMSIAKNEQLQVSPRTFLSRAAKNPLAKHLLAGAHASNGKLRDAIKIYSDARRIQEHPNGAVEYYPYHKFIVGSPRFGLLITPPEFAIAKKAMIDKQKELIDEWMSPLDDFENFFAYSGMSSAHSHLGEPKLAQQMLEAAVYSLFQYSSEANWYAYSGYDKRLVAESLIWLAFIKASERDNESLSFIEEKVEEVSKELGCSHSMLYSSRLSMVYAASKNKERSLVHIDNALQLINETDRSDSQRKTVALTGIAAAYNQLGMPTKASKLFDEIIRSNMEGSATLKNDIWEYAGRHWFDSGLSWPQVELKVRSEPSNVRFRTTIGYLTGMAIVVSPEN